MPETPASRKAIRTEDLRAEQAARLVFQRAIAEGLRFADLPAGPAKDVICRCRADGESDAAHGVFEGHIQTQRHQFALQHQ